MVADHLLQYSRAGYAHRKAFDRRGGLSTGFKNDSYGYSWTYDDGLMDLLADYQNARHGR